MATGKTKLRDVILEAIATRGILNEGKDKPNVNSKTLNANIKKLIEANPLIMKKEIADPWKAGPINAFSSYLTQWENLKMPDSKMSVLDMPIEQFKDKSVLEYVAKKVKEKGFKYGASLETVFDQITKYSGYDTDKRYFTEFFGTRTGSKVKIKTGTGTGRGRKLVDLPNDIYASLREIEKGINNPLSRITAQFMNLTGHRGKEISTLNIEDFKKIEGTRGEGSSYGGKYNLHATGWGLKQNYKAMNFTVLGKILIHNALMIAEKEGRTTGPLFPSAIAVDDIVTRGLIANYGEKAIETYVTGKEEAEAGSPTRALLRKLAKGRYLMSEGIAEFAGPFYKGAINILQGIADQSTENNYPSINDREGAINHVGKFVDNRFIAFSGSNNLYAFLAANNLEVPEGLNEYVKEQSTPDSRYLITGRNFLAWMPKEARAKLLTNTPVNEVPVTEINYGDIQEQREDSKIKQKIKTKASTRKDLIEAEKAKTADINLMKVEFMKQGFSEDEALTKARNTLGGKIEKYVDPLNEADRDYISENMNEETDNNIKKIAQENKLDLKKEKDVRLMLKELFKKGKGPLGLGLLTGGLTMLEDNLSAEDLLGPGVNVYGYNVFDYDKGPRGLVVDKELADDKMYKTGTADIGDALPHEQENILTGAAKMGDPKALEHVERLSATLKRNKAYEEEQKKIKEEFKRAKQKEEMDKLLADPLGAID
tara:strand:- start:73 stop:2205 length:2133 start_codon:yes stop_codon:yes gene_type:complete